MQRAALAVWAACCLSTRALGLYADQAGKLDWHHRNLGCFTSAAFDGQGYAIITGKASTLASIGTDSGDLAWRHVLPSDDTVLAVTKPSPKGPTTTVSSKGRIVRMWSPLDGSLVWETSLPSEASTGAGENGKSVPSIVLTESAHVVVLSAGGLHVLAASSGAMLAQWWLDPLREPDLGVVAGTKAQVTFTSLGLIPGDSGRVVAGGWSTKKKGSMEVEAFLVAEIHPAERSLTFKAAKTSKCGASARAGVTLALAHGKEESGYAVVGVCNGGKSLSIFGPSYDDHFAAEVQLPSGVIAESLSNLDGTDSHMMEVRGSAGSVAAIALVRSERGGISVVSGGKDSIGTCSIAGSSGLDHEVSCDVAGAMTSSRRLFVATALSEQAGQKVTIDVAEVSLERGDWVSGGTASLTAARGSDACSKEGRFPLIDKAFLEAKEGSNCAASGYAEINGICVRALVVRDDESAVMIGPEGIRWQREEGLAAVNQVVFVDSSKDELSLLAAAGKKIEHHVPTWKERLELQGLEISGHLDAVLKTFNGPRLTGEEVMGGSDAYSSKFGLKKLAVCSTSKGKIFALNMLDGSVAWSIMLPLSAAREDSRVMLHATRAKGALGYNPEVAVVVLTAEGGFVSWRDASNGRETGKEGLSGQISSVVPLPQKDSQERSLLMMVKSDGGVFCVPQSAESKNAFAKLLPKLFHHRMTEERGLESFAVVPSSDDEDQLVSSLVASVPVSGQKGTELLAIAYPDARDTLETPAHTLGDDSLLIKYVNPKMMAVATLRTKEDVTDSSDALAKELTVTILDSISGRILHRISHKGATKPVNMMVSESWVVYTYWSAAAQRTEVSTLSLYEGMIDKFGLSPFNRPEWKQEFSSFESKVPIVLQKSFIFPHPVTALGSGLTEHGITAKNFLVGTGLGQIVSLDRRFLDPRRPQEEPTKAQKEEKLIQYQPYLPVIPTQVLSYTEVIEGINRIMTEPTGLESTSLVLAIGLDLFGTRVAPSKTYDMLDPNFNYTLLILVLTAMAAAVLVLRSISASKRLKDQWA